MKPILFSIATLITIHTFAQDIFQSDAAIAKASTNLTSCAVAERISGVTLVKYGQAKNQSLLQDQVAKDLVFDLVAAGDDCQKIELALNKTISQTVDKKNKPVKCVVNITENGVKEKKHEFTFRCDNYGKGATVVSKSKRFQVIAFSEESCTPQFLIHDGKVNSSSVAFSIVDDGKGFEIFENRILASGYIADRKRDQVIDGADSAKNKVIIGCSTNPELLKDFGY